MLESASRGGQVWSGGVIHFWSGGVWSWRGLLLGGLVPEVGSGPGGGVCSQGGISQHALRQTAPPPVDRHKPVKILPWPNFVAAGNNNTWILNVSARGRVSRFEFEFRAKANIVNLLWSYQHPQPNCMSAVAKFPSKNLAHVSIYIYTVGHSRQVNQLWPEFKLNRETKLVTEAN